MVLKALIQNQFHSMATVTSASHSPTAIISHLAHSIEDIRHAQAKACAVWLVGQYSQDASGGVVKWAPDVLRKCVRSFVDEVRK
jgi:AP-3 complex subunit beta